MDKLYPIIRRKRRPLVVAESVPDGPPKPPVAADTVQPVAAKPLVESVPPETDAEKSKTSDVEIPPTTETP
jgi:hypothetical protein